MSQGSFNINVYKNLAASLSNMINDETRKDVTFVFKDSEVEIKAHKLVLENASPVFKSMFSGNFAEDDKVEIHDIKPDIFQVLMNGIYLRPISIQESDLEFAADLYYAAEKYDIGDIRDLSSSFMIKNCHSGNIHFLLKKAKMFNLPELEFACKNFFLKNTYEVLCVHFRLKVDDDTYSELFALEGLRIQSEFELYLALQQMWELKRLADYRKCLKQIRFLTMDIRFVLLCDLLSTEEKFAIISNIEARTYNDTPMILMPSHLSTETNSRFTVSYSVFQRQTYWTGLLLSSNNYDSRIQLFYKVMNISEERQPFIGTLIKEGRKQMKTVGAIDHSSVVRITKSIFP